MFKTMLLLKRKPGMTMPEFIDYYESNHAPLGIKYQPQLKRYIRHYLHAAPYPLDGTIVEAEYDVLTEQWYEDRNAYEEAVALTRSPEASRIIGQDVANFINPANTRFAFIEEYESEIPGKTPKASDIKCFVLLKRKPGSTIEEFIDYYETRHAPLGHKYSAVAMTRYRRHFLRPVALVPGGEALEPAYDVATECCFANREDMVLAKKLMSDPEINAIIEADEANFLDRTTRNFMFVEDRESVLS